MAENSPRPPREVVVGLAVTFVRRGLREDGKELEDHDDAKLEIICRSVLNNVASKMPDVVACLDAELEMADRMEKLEDLVVVLAEAVLDNVIATGAFAHNRTASNISAPGSTSMSKSTQKMNSKSILPSNHEHRSDKASGPTVQLSTKRLNRKKSVTQKLSHKSVRASPSARHPERSRPRKTTGEYNDMKTLSFVRNSGRLQSLGMNQSVHPLPKSGKQRTSKHRTQQSCSGRAHGNSTNLSTLSCTQTVKQKKRNQHEDSLKSKKCLDKPSGNENIRGSEIAAVINCSLNISFLARQGFGTLYQKLCQQDSTELGLLREAILRLPASNTKVSSHMREIDTAKIVLFVFMSTKAFCKIYDRILEEHDSLHKMASKNQTYLAHLQLGCDLLNRLIHHSRALRSVVLETVSLLFGRHAVDKVDRECFWIVLDQFAHAVVETMMRYIGLTLTPGAYIAWQETAPESIEGFQFAFHCFQELYEASPVDESSSNLQAAGKDVHVHAPLNNRSEEESRLPNGDTNSKISNGDMDGESKKSARKEGGEYNKDNKSKKNTTLSTDHGNYAPEDATQGGVDLGSGHERICVSQEEWRRLLTNPDLSAPERQHEPVRDHASHVSLHGDTELSEEDSNSEISERAERHISFAEEDEVHSLPPEDNLDPLEAKNLWYSNTDIQRFLAESLDDEDDNALEISNNDLDDTTHQLNGGIRAK